VPPPVFAYWRDLGARYVTALCALPEIAEAAVTVQDFLKHRHRAWNLVGRVHFNSRREPKGRGSPFAFLATYTTRLSAAAKAQHLQLGKALQEYSGAKNRDRLLSLLIDVPALETTASSYACRRAGA
jgi:hypothetical protein